jgi:hypothetical protein
VKYLLYAFVGILFQYCGGAEHRGAHEASDE